MTEPLRFEPSEPFTVGVELEFQILDATDLNLTSRSPMLLEDVPESFTTRIKAEFIQSMVEATTGVCRNVSEVAGDLESAGRTLEDLARKRDCLIFASSLHPFAQTAEQKIFPDQRYHDIMEELQIVGRRLITQGLHVHVGVADGETAVRVCDGIRAFLPVLLALTTSSPFFEGWDTGLYSYRSKLFEALPQAGMPRALGRWENFVELVGVLTEVGVIKGVRDLWWDVRPHPDFGTVETRICDLPSRFDEVLAMAAVIQALVATLSRDTVHRTMRREIVLNNKWCAARYGLEGRFVEPSRMTETTLGDAAQDLLELVGPAARDLGGGGFLGPIRRIIEDGTSAHRQRQLYAEKRDFREVLRTFLGNFWL